MHIGTIVSLAGGFPADERAASRICSVFPRNLRSVTDILGQNLLERMKAKARQTTEGPIYVVPERPGAFSALPSRSANRTSFVAAWEGAVRDLLSQGAQQLLLMRVGGYTELDFRELLKFHMARHSRLTQAYGPAGELDVAVVSASALRNGDGAYERVLASLIPRRERFPYQGYINSLKTPKELRKLVEDALNGRCNLRPVGAEIEPGTWVAEGALISESVTIIGPAFIGAGVRIAEYCTIAGTSTIERGCKIDFGTNVSQSCVLQYSYVGVGLDLNGVIVNHGRLYHGERNIHLQINDRRLISPMRADLPVRLQPQPYYGIQ